MCDFIHSYRRCVLYNTYRTENDQHCNPYITIFVNRMNIYNLCSASQRVERNLNLHENDFQIAIKILVHIFCV